MITIILLAFIAIQTDIVQNFLLRYSVNKLSKSLNTEVNIRKISFSLFNRLNLEGTIIRDRNRDTLLFAQQVKVRITDWFFLKDKADLKYIGLESAVVKLQRKTPAWNYQFLVDFFASPTPSKNKKGGIELNIKKLDLKNVRFVKNDEWAGERMNVNIGSLLLDAENVDLNKMVFNVNTITLDDALVKIQSLVPLRPKPALVNPTAKDTGMYFNTGDMLAVVGNIKFNNCALFLDADEDKPSVNFDGAHIQLTKLNGNINTISFIKDTLRANIDIAVKDRSGIELKKLKANFRLTPQIMELAKMDLQTAKSRLTNYYAMQFKDFNKDFGHYNSKVVMNAYFKEAKVNSDDIAYFAPELRSWKKEVRLNGHFFGTVEDFTVTGLKAQSGSTSYISGNLTMKGLPDINKTNINLTNGVLQTNYADLGIFIPAVKDVKDPKLSALGTVFYRGSFKGTINNFVTAGTFSTQLGGLISNVTMQLPRKGDPVYTGAIETVRFNVGKFLGDTSLGLVDFKGKIMGSSFNIDRLKTTLEGKISSLEFNHYKYTNIITNGTFQRKYFTGEIKIDDPNLDFTSTVEIDLTKPLPRFNIVGDLVHTNLNALNLLGTPFEITGLLDANFTGTNIDNFSGTAKFLNASIKNGTTSVSFDSLALTSSKVDSIKLLNVTSNEFNATILGKFSILDLPGSFQGFLNHYYPAYIKPSESIPQNQQFSFIINTNDNIEPYIQLIDKKMAGFNNAIVTGSVDTRNNILGLDARIPYGKIKNISFTGLDIFGKGSKDTLSVNGTIAGTQVGDSLRFPNTRLNIVSNNDHSVVSIRTSADNTLNDADLYADVYTLPDGVRLQFRPSSFVLNDKKWGIEKAGEITVRNHFIQAQNVKFSQGFQEISLETEEEDGGNTSNLVVKLKNVVLGDVSSLFFKNPKLQGITSGNIVMKDFFGQFAADANLKAEQFRLNDDSIGLVNIHAGYNSKTGEIPFTVQSPNESYKFSAKGSYNALDSTGRSFNTDIAFEDSKIDILHMFLSDIFTDLKGQAKGNLNISGNLNAPDLLGKVRLTKGGMKVNYTQVYYTIDSADISFDEKGMNFANFVIHDKYNNSGIVSGRINEKGFKNLDFDLDISSDKLLMIDTKAIDNQQFYGKAIGKIKTFSLKGPETNCKLFISAESNDSSHIFIPNSVSRESGTADFIEFRQYGTEMIKEKTGSNFNLSVDLDITATNKVAIDVILDELTGDVIKAVGNGKLRIRAGTTEPLTIRGRYNIERGSYDFNFQSIVRKPFELLPDAGNYIEWTGDPFNADVHIDARYTAERVSLSDLIGGLNLSGAVKGYLGDVYVIAQLREKLTKPEIRFKLDFPQGSPVKTDNDFSQFLTRLERDQNEILKQVAFLIALNTFAPPDAASVNSTNAYNINTLFGTTISQVLSKVINNVVTNLLYKITGDRRLRLDVGTSLYSSSSLISGVDPTGPPSSNRIDRTRFDMKLGYAFAKDKIIVTLGSDLDFGLGNTASTLAYNTQWLPNLNIEFVLSKDKKLRLIVFNKTTLDVSFGIRKRQGVSISYRKDFEKLFPSKNDDIVYKAAVDTIR